MLTWKLHLQEVETWARRKLALLSNLEEATQRADEKNPRTVYEDTVRPQLEYGAAAWTSSLTTTLQFVDKVQNRKDCQKHEDLPTYRQRSYVITSDFYIPFKLL